MAEIKYTEAQQAALDTSCGKIVLAGAGSGKTTVLTERYLRLLQLKNVEPDDIVAMTFTKKAAAQLQTKIIEKINNKIIEDPNNKEFWTQKSRNMIWAQIGTIHSICARLLRNYPLAAGVDPEFIIDNNTQTAVQKEIKLLLKRKIYAKNHHLKVLLKKVKIDEVEFLIQYIFSNIELQNSIKKVLEDKERTCSELVEIQKNLQAVDVNHSFKNPTSDNHSELILMLESLYLLSEPLLNKNNDSLKILSFDDLEKRTWRLLQNKKIKQSITSRIKYIMVDEFQDTSLLQWKIVRSLAEENDGTINADKLFLVGDEKQSIYGFRNANVTVLEKAKDDFLKFYKQKNESIQNHSVFINLNDNFRTCADLINPLNQAFEGLLKPQTNDWLSFEAKPQYLVPRREYSNKYSGKVEFALSFDGSRTSTYRYIALQILDAKKSLYIPVGKNEMRKIEYSDMAILLRKRTHLAELEEVLNEYNIPFHSDSGSSLFERQEILDIINLIAAFADSRDTISLAGLLRGPFFSLADSTITVLMINGENAIKNWSEFIKDEDYKTEFELLSEDDRLILKERWQVWEDLKIKSGTGSIIDFLNEALQISGAWAVYSMGEGGKQKVENIKKFLDIINELSGKGYITFNSLNIAIKELMDQQQGEETNQAKIEPENGVQILTIHKSKGLEFPFVIIPDLFDYLSMHSTTPNYGDLMLPDNWLSPVLAKELYILGKQRPENVKNSIFTVHEWKKQVLADAEELAELKRMMYVAATRAKDRLLLVSNVEFTTKGVLKGQGKSRLYFWIEALGLKLSPDNIEKNTEIEGIDVIKINNEYINQNLEQLLLDINSRKVQEEKMKGGFPEILINKPYPKTELHFSVTAFCLYLANPREYPLEKLLWLIESENDEENIQASHPDSLLQEELKPFASEIGNFVHNYLSQASLRLQPVENLVLREFETSVDSDRVMQKLIDNINLLINNHNIMKDYPNDAKQELGITFKLNETIFKGRIDCAWRDKNYAYIIDYKTNAIISNDCRQVAENSGYIHQCKLYSLALQSAWRVQEVKSSLYFLYPGEKLEVELKNSDRDYYLNCVEYVRKEMLAVLK